MWTTWPTPSIPRRHSDPPQYWLAALSQEPTAARNLLGLSTDDGTPD